MVQTVNEIGKKWDMLELLQWAINKYLVYDFIWNHNKCIPKEVITGTGMSLGIVYKYIKECSNLKLIDKNHKKKYQRDSSRYIIIAKPKLKEAILEFRRLILDLSQKIKKTGIDL